MNRRDIVAAQLAELRKIRANILRAIEVVEALKNGEEMLAPLGGGIFVRIKGNDEVLVDVGAGVIVEKDVESLEKHLKTQLERVEKEIELLRSEGRKDADTQGTSEKTEG